MCFPVCLYIHLSACKFIILFSSMNASNVDPNVCCFNIQLCGYNYMMSDCPCAGSFVNMFVCPSVYISIGLCVCMFVCMYTCMYICLSLSVCLYVCYIYIYIYIYIYVYWTFCFDLKSMFTKIYRCIFREFLTFWKSYPRMFTFLSGLTLTLWMGKLTIFQVDVASYDRAIVAPSSSFLYSIVSVANGNEAEIVYVINKLTDEYIHIYIYIYMYSKYTVNTVKILKSAC